MLVRKLSAITSVLSLSLISTAVFASTSPSNYKSTLNLPMQSAEPRFEFTFDPMALKAGAANLNYVIYNNELPVQSPKWYEQELKPKYAFAFELGGKYFFSGGSDVSLDWTHLYSSTSSNVAAPNANYFVGPDYEIGPDATDIRAATGNVKFRYDVINLNAGQAVDLTNHVKIHLFGGLSDGLLREEVNATYTGTAGVPFAGNFSMQQKVNANFTGLGPRFGLDASFNTDCGLSFYGQGAISALIGSSYSKTGFTGASAELIALFGQTVNSQLITDQSLLQVVPAIDTKLGVNYKRAFRNVMVTVGAGWQAAVYINAINQYLPGTLVTGAGDTSIDTGGIFVGTMSHTQSNYSVQGPFLNFAVAF